MFFTAELLQKRDSGFGLLWLAATLGSQSVFKKLPKRSVLSADISELCEAIAEPSEPLALRLTSNLLVGVVRVYKVKQELLMNDVTTCSNSLRRMLHDVLSPISDINNLQMAQPAVKPGAVTLAANPQAAFALEFDNLIADWDEYLNVGGKRKNPENEENDSDGDYNPKSKRAKGKNKQKAMAPPSSTEKARANAHTLQEFHEHLLSNPQDLSLHGGDTFAPSSSQMEDGFAFNDFGFDDNALDLGALGDDILRELDEGWGAPPPESCEIGTERNLNPLIDQPMNDMDIDLNIPLGGDMDIPTYEDQTSRECIQSPQQELEGRSFFACNSLAFLDGNNPAFFKASAGSTRRAPSLTPSFTRQLLSQEEVEPFSEVANLPSRPAKKQKRTRLLLDARTELTDEELKATRARYLEEQNQLREEMRRKQAEKLNSRMLEELVSGVPPGMNAPGLIDFWRENCQIQVKPRTAGHGVTDVPLGNTRCSQSMEPRVEHPMNFDGDLGNMEVDLGFNMDIEAGDGLPTNFDAEHRRSSEDPEQGRNAFRHPSVIPSDIGSNLGQGASDSQAKKYDAMFPWDNAFGTSSGGSFSPLAQPLEVGGNVRMFSSSPSRSSLSQAGSGGGSSPGPLLSRQSMGVDEFELEVPPSAPVSALESQGSSVNVATLEKNSSNFLEYAKMQYQSLQTGIAPGITAQLMFEHIVPKDTCTRHVAAAAFYHCLMLATKNLIHVKQEEAYGPVAITIL